MCDDQNANKSDLKMISNNNNNNNNDQLVIPGFNSRNGFMTIGTFKHAPNVDSLKWLCAEIWPLIRARIPDAQLTIYGAHITQKHFKMFDNPKQGVRIGGWIPSEGNQGGDGLTETLQTYRVMLAPLRFGAGLKGKIIDGWRSGTPVVTTSIGIEGILACAHDDAQQISSPDCLICKTIADDAETFASIAIDMHERVELWTSEQETGYKVLRSCFDADRHLKNIKRRIEAFMEPETRFSNRAKDYMGAMQWLSRNRWTTYFSRWIELKEKLAKDLPKQQQQ